VLSNVVLPRCAPGTTLLYHLPAPQRRTLEKDARARGALTQSQPLTREGLHPYDFFATGTCPDYLR